MLSILTVVALNAHADNIPVISGSQFQARLDSACLLPANTGPHVIELPAGEFVIEGTEVGVYPSPSCPPNPADIIIRGSVDGTVVRSGEGFDGVTTASLIRVTEGVNVTVEGTQNGRLTFLGPTCSGLLDVITNAAGDTVTPQAVRAIRFDGNGASSYGKLTVNYTEFRCFRAVGDASTLDDPSGFGGAIVVEGGALDIDHSRFINNSATGRGGAIALRTGPGAFRYRTDATIDTLTVRNTRFEFNEAMTGGAVYNGQPNNSTTVVDSRFLYNNGYDGAGGMELENQALSVIERNEFDSQNHTLFQSEQKGGAIRVTGRGGPAVSTGSGTVNRSLLFKNNIVCGSWAGRGGGLYVDSVSEVNVYNSIFAENGALLYGGGVFFSDEEDFGMDIEVVNNTFVGNEAGREPEFLPDGTIYDFGGGGAASFFGVSPRFQNNVVAYSQFGGGVFGEYRPFNTEGYQIGDPLSIYNNLFYDNTDARNGIIHVTGDFATAAYHPSNILDEDPGLTYLGLGEFNCVPEAFYPVRGSITIDAGGGPIDNSGVPGICFDMVDLDTPPDFDPESPDGPCDIGAFGGEYAMWRKDSDGDGVSNIFDCDDTRGSISPEEPEVCDFFDNDCNGIVDDDLETLWYLDQDQDGSGDRVGGFVLSCADPGGGRVANKDDCDDQNPTVYLGAPEVCDGLDNDCNELIDDELTIAFYYYDSDGDSYGANSTGVETCAPPDLRWVTESGDCDDLNPAVNPGAAEICDGIDNDCDNVLDAEDEDAAGPQVSTYYPDLDGDGYGDTEQGVKSCSNSAPAGYILKPGDCNDSSPDIHAEAPELCHNIGVDEDCDGLIDELDENTGDALKVYQDADGDGLGSQLIFQVLCEDAPPAGYVTNFNDCDDGDGTVGECAQSCSVTGGPKGMLLLGMSLFGVLVRRRR